VTLLLQVSDAHFGTERGNVVAALQQLVREQRPDVLLLSGDITQRATRRQFTAARAFVDALGVPQVIAIPGNHDIPLFNLAARVLWPYARYRRAFGDDLEPCFANDDLLLLALNTTRWYRHVDGELSGAQIERVARHLERAPPMCWRLIVVHQPVAVTDPGDAHDLLHGHEAALQRWSEAGADVVLGGHIHLPYVVALHQRRPTLPRPLWVVQAGTALSRRVRVEAPNSVNLLRIDAAGGAGADRGRQLTVERWDCAADAQRFERVAVHRLHEDSPQRSHGPAD